MREKGLLCFCISSLVCCAFVRDILSKQALFSSTALFLVSMCMCTCVCVEDDHFSSKEHISLFMHSILYVYTGIFFSRLVVHVATYRLRYASSSTFSPNPNILIELFQALHDEKRGLAYISLSHSLEHKQKKKVQLTLRTHPRPQHP